MTYIVNKSGGYGAGGNKSTKATLKKGRTFFFDTFDKAYKFCTEHGLDYDDIHAKYKTYSVTIK